MIERIINYSENKKYNDVCICMSINIKISLSRNKPNPTEIFRAKQLDV